MKPQQTSRIVELDCIRGLAAIMVMVFHCLIIFPILGVPQIWNQNILDSTSFHQLILRFLLHFFNGGLGVLIFFVLSGYVLRLSYVKVHNKFKHGNIVFYIKRIVRLYPAHIFFVLIYFGLLIEIDLKEFLLRYINEKWLGIFAMYDGILRGISSNDLIKNISLVSTTINQVTWSLKVEILMSLYFPLIIFFWKKYYQLFYIFSLFSIIVLDGGTHLYYLLPFLLGISVCELQLKIKDEVFRFIRIRYMILLWILLISINICDFLLPEKLIYVIQNFIIFLIISIVICYDFRKYRRHIIFKIFSSLGRMSYSIYLCHLPIIFFMVIILFHYFGVSYERHPVISYAYLVLSVFFFSIGLSLFSFNLIEKPFVNYFNIILDRWMPYIVAQDRAEIKNKDHLSTHN